MLDFILTFVYSGHILMFRRFLFMLGYRVLMLIKLTDYLFLSLVLLRF